MGRMKRVFENEYLSLYWDEVRRFQLAQWTGEYLGDRIRGELDRALERFFELQAKHADAAWLADVRELEVLNAKNQKWCDEQWFPRLLATDIRLMAIVTPRSVLAKMSVEALMSQIPSTTLTVRYCATVEDAAQWINSTRGRT